jgi:monoamine oxidase
MDSTSVTRDYDVAVIGGGVSGAYTAWRLRTEGAASPVLKDLARKRPDGKLAVTIFEYSDRIGGRLYSMRLPGVPHLPIELGGMRFLNSHKRVNALIERYKLQYRPLPTMDPKLTNFFYVRGKHFTAADWNNPSFEPPFQMDRGERARTPGDLLIDVALKYRDVAHKMQDKGFWNLLLDEYSEEAYHLIREAGGYDTIVNNWSTAEAIPFLLADFAPGSQYFALNEGFQALPLRLAAEFEKAGGQIVRQRRLYSLKNLQDGRIELTFDAGNPANFAYRKLQKAENCIASHVVLAMPRRAIEGLHPDSFIFESSEFEENVRTVLPQAGFKIFAAYAKPWWQTARNVSAGRSITSLPVRQCYYWGTEENAPDGMKGNTNSILMASYNDGLSTEYWAGLARHPERYTAPDWACPPGVPIPDHVKALSASAPMVAELQSQLREMHGLSALEGPRVAPVVPPYVAVYRDWTVEPFGGGWHFWKIGVDANAVMEYMRRPFKDVPLYVCGEAWSRQQGWVEGALETADLVLEKTLHLPALK